MNIAILLILSILSAVAQAQDCENMELLHRTTCPNYYNSIVWDAGEDFILYGDSLILERLVIDEDNRFRPVGFHQWDLGQRQVSVVIAGDIAVVGLTDGIATLDMSGKGWMPVLDLFEDGRTYRNVQSNGEVALAIATDSLDDPDGNIVIFSLDNPEDLNITAEIEANFLNLAMGNEMIAAVDSTHGVALYDISDPAEPSFIGDVCEVYPYMLSFAGDVLALVVDGTGLMLFDCRDPGNPVAGDTLLTNWREICGLEGQFNLLAVDGKIGYADSCPLSVYDVQSPNDPLELACIDLINRDDILVSRPNSLQFKGKSIFVYDVNIMGQMGIHQYLLEDEVNLFHNARYYAPFGAWGMFLHDDDLFLLEESRLQQVDVTTPENAIFPYSAYGFYFMFYYDLTDIVFGDTWIALAEMSEEGYDGKVYLFNIPVEGSIILTGVIPRVVPEYGLIDVKGMLGVGIHRNTWRFYGMNDPFNPEFIRELDLPVSGNAVCREDSFLFDLSRDTLRIFEMNEAIEFGQIAALAVEGNSFKLHGDIAYILADDGISLVNIVDADEPSLIVELEIEGIPLDMAFAGEVGYIVVEDGVVGYDFSDPEHPVEVAHYHDPANVRRRRSEGLRSVAIKEDILYLSGGHAWDDPMGLLTFRIESDHHVAQNNTALPGGFKIIGAYPNPFNSSTTIVFHLPIPSPVNVAVHDLAGRQVVVLCDGWRGAGENRLSFNPDGLPSGIYLLSLSARDIKLNQKVVLLK